MSIDRFAIAVMLEELDKRIFNEFFVISSNMVDMTFEILLSWEWLQTKNSRSSCIKIGHLHYYVMNLLLPRNPLYTFFCSVH